VKDLLRERRLSLSRTHPLNLNTSSQGRSRHAEERREGKENPERNKTEGERRARPSGVVREEKKKRDGFRKEHLEPLIWRLERTRSKESRPEKRSRERN